MNKISRWIIVKWEKNKIKAKLQFKKTVYLLIPALTKNKAMNLPKKSKRTKIKVNDNYEIFECIYAFHLMNQIIVLGQILYGCIQLIFLLPIL